MHFHMAWGLPLLSKVQRVAGSQIKVQEKVRSAPRTGDQLVDLSMPFRQRTRPATWIICFHLQLSYIKSFPCGWQSSHFLVDVKAWRLHYSTHPIGIVKSNSPGNPAHLAHEYWTLISCWSMLHTLGLFFTITLHISVVVGMPILEFGPSCHRWDLYAQIYVKCKVRSRGHIEASLHSPPLTCAVTKVKYDTGSKELCCSCAHMGVL